MKQNSEKNFRKYKNYMKNCRIEVLKPKTEDKTANQFNFCCSSKKGILYTVTIDIDFLTANKFKFKIKFKLTFKI